MAWCVYVEWNLQIPMTCGGLLIVQLIGYCCKQDLSNVEGLGIFTIYSKPNEEIHAT